MPVFEPLHAALIVLAVWFFFPVFLLGLHKLTLLGYLSILLNVVAFPTLWLNGSGILVWVLALMLAAMARAERLSAPSSMSH